MFDRRVVVPMTEAHPLSAAAAPVSDEPLMPPDVRKTGYVYDPSMTLHSTLAAEPHPERPERITSIFTMLQMHGCIHRMHRILSREASLAEVSLVHTEELWHSLEETVQLPEDKLRELIAFYEAKSLYLNRSSTLCARLSCGSAIELCKAVASGRVQNGFAIVRPPGHHAEPDGSQGFCLYNNVAIATRTLLHHAARRIMILDWDVHHGNGTQRIFWNDSNVLYISLHRYENGTFYPGTTFGNYDQVGGPDALGTSVNVPWPCTGMGDADYLHAFQQCILPIAYEFAPDLVIVSAGFDAADGDVLGGCRVSPTGYAHMTHQLMALAHGRLAVVLEGGYTLDAISRSALAVVRTLLGDALPPLPRGTAASTAAVHTVQQVIRAQAPHWQCMRTAMSMAPMSSGTGACHSFSLPSLFLEARAARLWSSYQLLPLPMYSDGLAPHQVLCSSSFVLPTTDTFVVFVHDLGTLHQDASGAPYVSDAADALVAWATSRHYAILDLCTLTPLPREAVCSPTHERVPDTTPTHLYAHIESLWDHVCALSAAKRFVLVGLGTGCHVLMHLIAARALHHRVAGVVQVLGTNPIPLVPKSHPELKSWYLEHAHVVCPPNHPHLAWSDQASSGKRLGRVQRATSACPMDTLAQTIPLLEDMLRS